MLTRLTSRKEWQFFAALRRASPGLALVWWVVLVLRGMLTAVLSIGFGWLVGNVRSERPLAAPLVLVGVAFTLSLVLHPIQQFISTSVGARLSAHLNDRLMKACVSPTGIAHLERPEFATDLAMARDFDLGMMGPPLDISMDFIAGGLLDLVIGLSAALLLFAFHWWAPLVLLAGWFATHWLLRESGVWKDRNTDEVRTAQRHADYSYRLAVDAPAAKEVRLFGLAGWVIDRFITSRRRLYELQYEATRIREKSLAGALVLVVAANLLVFWAIAQAATNDSLSVGRVVVFIQAAIGTAAIAFGGLNWALDGASAPVAAIDRLERSIAQNGDLRSGTRSAASMPARDIRFRDVRFAYTDGGRAVLDGFDLTIPAGTSMAIVGQNGAGKTTLAKLLCRLYDPQSGTIEVDGTNIQDLELTGWRNRVTAVFQDFIRFERTLRDNVAPAGASDDVIRAALTEAGADHLAELDTILSKAYPDGTDLSGGQWQRIALARVVCSVQQGAGLVLLDEPTAQLDVRGEAEIFERLLAATRQCTTILISHRFSTVRQADCICVIEDGRVAELGSHDELIALGGRYRTMFDLQASRFTELDDQGQEVEHETL